MLVKLNRAQRVSECALFRFIQMYVYPTSCGHPCLNRNISLKVNWNKNYSLYFSSHVCFGQAYFVTLQLDPSMRSVGNSSAPTANKNCLVHGVDQGFHNWLLYSGQLSQMMNVKIFQQGEGPVTYSTYPYILTFLYTYCTYMPRT
jgi:hypothetical protein